MNENSESLDAYAMAAEISPHVTMMRESQTRAPTRCIIRLLGTSNNA
jgi:hypothetical protein